MATKIKTAKGLLRRTYELFNSNRIEWDQGFLIHDEAGRTVTVEPYKSELKPRHKFDYETGKPVEIPVNPRGFFKACLMGGVELAAVQFLHPDVSKDKVVAEAFKLLAEDILSWEDSSEDLKQEYRDYVEDVKESNSWYREDDPGDPILSFDEWQVDRIFLEKENVIADFNDGPDTRKEDALRVLRRAARISDSKP